MTQPALQDALDAVDDIERALARLRGALTSLAGEVEASAVQRALRKTQPARQLMATVADFYGTTVAELTGPGLGTVLIEPRHMAMYMLREHLGMTWPGIGDLMKRDHSTVHYAVNKLRSQIAALEWVRADRDAILAKLAAGG